MTSLVGILVAIYSKGKSASIKNPLLVGFLVSCLIEILQLLFCKGYCETNDIIHNTIGCILGYGVYDSTVSAYITSSNECRISIYGNSKDRHSAL